MAHLLIVDDEESICWGFEKLAREMGHTSEVAPSAERGLRLAAERRPDLIVLDVRLPGMDGLTAMARFGDVCGPVPTIVITAFGALSTAVEAVRQGAFDYLTKPFELDDVQAVIERALQRPAQPPLVATAPVDTDDDTILGRSPAMQDVFKRIALAATSDACVHLSGESGTGKDLVARAIHCHSRRAEGPFVPVNVAALSPALAESELFGHVQGAFTGAERARAGLLKSADGGTVFLDEIGDMPSAVQVKLLRALEYGEFLPVGADRPQHSDFRLLSATHQDLQSAIALGRFRHDLYFRLNTLTIEIPPLRNRCEDIPLLVSYFLERIALKNDAPALSIGPEAIEVLARRRWNGNVRELRNAIEHAVVLARNGVIMPEHLPPPLSLLAHTEHNPRETLADVVREWAGEVLENNEQIDSLYALLLQQVEPPVLQMAMRQARGSCAAAARLLGLHRITLRKKLDQYGIETD